MKRILTTLSANGRCPIEGAVNIDVNFDVRAEYVTQTKTYITGLPCDPRKIVTVVSPGSPHVAAALFAAFDRLTGQLPVVLCNGFGPQTAEVIGELNLDTFRHNDVRSRRDERPRGEAYHGWSVLNGTPRALADYQREQLANQLGCAPTDIRELSLDMGQSDLSQPHKGMVEKAIGSGLTVEDVTSGRVMHLPAGNGLVGGVMEVVLYGLYEAWLPMPRFAPSGPGRFDLAEIVDVQAMRPWADNYARELAAAQPTVTLAGDISADFRRLLNELAEAHGVTIRG